MAVNFTISNSIGTVLIDRQEKLNALDISSFETIDRIVNEVRNNPDVHGLLVLSSGDQAFSVGVDISELAKLTHKESLEKALYRQSVLSNLSTLNIPTVAGIQGYALGGGLELALSCTFRVATQNSRLGCPEINLGLLPGAGGTQRLSRLIGKNRAMKMMLTGCTVQPAEALSIGLIDGIVENSHTGACDFLKPISRFSTGAVRGIMNSINASDLPLDIGLKIENQQLSLIIDSPDANEGLAAFMEKRTPQFNRKH